MNATHRARAAVGVHGTVGHINGIDRCGHIIKFSYVIRTIASTSTIFLVPAQRSSICTIHIVLRHSDAGI